MLGALSRGDVRERAAPFAHDGAQRMSSTLSRLDGNVPDTAHSGWRGTLNDYYEITKPRIMYLLLITTFAAMVMAARGRAAARAHPRSRSSAARSRPVPPAPLTA